MYKAKQRYLSFLFIYLQSNKPQLYVLEIHVIDSASNNVRLTVFSQLYHVSFATVLCATYCLLTF